MSTDVDGVTTLDPAPPPAATEAADGAVDVAVPAETEADADVAGAATGRDDEGVSGRTVIASSALASAAAAWMVAGVFGDFSAHWVALAGVVLGAGMVGLSLRLRTGIVQYAVVPVAALAGAALVAPFASGANSSLPAQVGDALSSGGLLQPPVPFEPGWRFILVVLFTVLTAGAGYLALALRRVKLGVAVPLPLVLGAAVIQPSQSEIPTVAVAMVLAVIGMTIAYGAELGGQGHLGVGFESRRLLRGLALAVLLAVGVVGISRVGILFPQPDRSHVIPPQRPPPPPALPDQVLFSYTASRPVPLRLGVIDVYDVTAGAWELPPYDPSRFVPVEPPAGIPHTGYRPNLPTVTATITVANLSGHSLPSLAGLSRLSAPGGTIDFDPRTDGVRLADRPVYSGYQYTMVGLAPPSGQQLGTAAKAGPALSAFLAAPPPPVEVTRLLDAYTSITLKQGNQPDPFSRLQYLRTALYSHVVAAGPGIPVDVGATRVAQMLDGSNASPYEITAGEALLARWAGVPSRMGYGYYGGDPGPGHTFQIHPSHGATWLEVYFTGYGWVPIVGVPPQAVPSTSTHPQNPVNIQTSNQLALIVYIPEEDSTLLGLYEYVRYYVVRGLPIAAGILLVVGGYPAPLKLLRRRRRRRWARTHGHAGRIAVAYCDLRDTARDLAIGDPAATPVEFTEEVAEDLENTELAWLVTRAFWGDLRRDLRVEDADAAERLARSVKRRLVRAQPWLSIVLGAAARTSLREPYSTEVPNVWIPRRRRLSLRPAIARWRRDLRRRRYGRRLAPVGAAILSAISLSSCGNSAAATAQPPRTLVPGQLGALRFDRSSLAEAQFSHLDSAALITGGLVYTVRHDDVTEGDIQVEQFKPKVSTADLQDSQDVLCTENPDDCTGVEVFLGMQQDIGSGHFQRIYVGNQRVYLMVLDNQRVYMWFPPGTNAMILMILRSQFTAASSDALMHALLAYQSGRTPGAVPIPSPSVVVISPGASASPSFAASGPGELPSAGASPSP